MQRFKALMMMMGSSVMVAGCTVGTASEETSGVAVDEPDEPVGQAAQAASAPPLTYLQGGLCFPSFSDIMLVAQRRSS